MVATTRKRIPKEFLRIDANFRRAWLTVTDGPHPEEGKRYRETYPGREIAHHWHRNKVPSGRASNFYFVNGTIYSYGSHFPIARHVINRRGERAIFFTTRTYSNTTARHLSYTRRAIPSGELVFHVHNPNADIKSEHRANLEWIKNEVMEAIDKASRARSNKPYYDGRALRLIQEGNAYAAWVGLKDRLGPPGGGDLGSWAAKVQEEARIAQERANAKQEEMRRKSLAEWDLKLKEWQSGEGDRKDVGRDPRTGRCFVRVSRGKYLQTSLGMTIPLAEVMPVLEMIRRGMAGNIVDERPTVQDWEGHANFDHKFFEIGCHTIDFAEIERAATAAGL
jgi:hypothetical protein